MSQRAARLILFFNDNLIIGENLVITYIGGGSRPLKVRANLTLEELKQKVRSALGILGGSLKLTCNYPYGSTFVATPMTNDDICSYVLDDATRETMGIYVEMEEGETSYSVVETNTLPPQSLPDYVHCAFSSVETDTIPPRLSTGFEPVDPYPYEPVEAREDADDAYESEDSSSSNSDAEDELEVPEDCDVEEGVKGHHLIRDHALRVAEGPDTMIRDNAYVHVCQSAKEWDADVTVDEAVPHTLLSEDVQIPVELFEGMCFSTKSQLQFAVAGWSICNNVHYAPITSNQKNLTLICTHHEDPYRACKWRLHCSASKRLGGAWRISRMGGSHTCVNVVSPHGHPQCTSRFIAFFILPALRGQIDMKPRDIIGRMESKFNIPVSYMKAWDARRKAIKALFGSWEESYRSLYLFMESICSAIPGSVYRIHTISAHRFQRIFWAFGPSISGWQYCRPVISLDGTFLLGKYRGTLLSAVGVDANNGLFPLAFAVVDAESIESWGWFLECLRDCLPSVTARPDLCLISDKHAGLLRGCREIFPFASHRHCLRHLRENFKKAVRRFGVGDVEFMCQKMYQAGSTDDVAVFTRLMTDILNIKVEAHGWLFERDVAKWTLLYDGGMRYGSMTTNASECFNSVLKRARGLPIQALITAIYYNVITFFLKRYQTATTEIQLNESTFTERTLQMLCRYEREARHLPTPIDINRSEVQVFDRASRSFRVQITGPNLCICSCGRCQLYHMPCPHAIAALAHRRLSYNTFVSPYYSLQYYLQAYAGEFHTLPDRSEWPNYDPENGLVEILPPPVRRRTGRPRTNRFRNSMDEGTSTSSRRRCGFCNAYGHYRGTCPHNK